MEHTLSMCANMLDHKLNGASKLTGLMFHLIVSLRDLDPINQIHIDVNALEWWRLREQHKLSLGTAASLEHHLESDPDLQNLIGKRIIRYCALSTDFMWIKREIPYFGSATSPIETCRSKPKQAILPSVFLYE